MREPRETVHEAETSRAFLLELGHVLRGPAEAATVQAEVCRLLCERLRVDRAYYAEVDGARHDVLVFPGYRRGDSPSLDGNHQPSELGWSFESMRQGRSTVVADTRSSGQVPRADRDATAALRIAAHIDVPLLRNGMLIGALCVTESEPRRWTDTEIELVQEAAGRIWPVIALARAEHALRDSETKLQTAIEDVPLAIALTGPAGEILFRNPRFDQLWGRPAHVTTASSYSAVYEGYHLDGRPIASEEWPGARAVLKGEVVENEVYEIVQADGRRIMCWFGAAPIRNAAGDISGGVVVFRDITDEIRTQTALRERKERQDFLLRLSDALRPLLDPIAIQREASRVLRAHLGAGRVAFWEIIEQETALEVTAEDTAADQPSFIGRRLRFEDCGIRGTEVLRRPVWHNDVSGIWGPGEPRQAALGSASAQACLSAPLIKEGRFVACLTVYFDTPHVWSPEQIKLIEEAGERTWAMVERAVAYRALRANEVRLEKANRAKDEFLAMLGHELRNPLAPIATTLQLMKMRAPEVFAREREIIAAQVGHLTALVDDLLDVARIAHGKFDLDIVPVDLADIVAAAVETARPQIEEFRQTLHTRVAHGLVVRADRRRLMQVMVNLLGNAAKYSPPDRHIHVSAAAEDGQAVLRVRDEGQGIAPELLPHVFDSFTQGAQAIDRARGGLGLGLTIVQNVVRALGGSVDAASEGIGMGSELTVRLPLVASRDTQSAPTDAGRERANAPSDAAGIKVLIVDDHGLAAESLALLLNEMGYRTRVAGDGAAALQAIVEFEPDAALVDIGLPVMDGYEVVRRVRVTPGREHLPLIAITGYGQTRDRARAMEAGFNEHLVKPVDAGRIGELINALVRHHRSTGPAPRER
jgi:signal transduction histidine kinase/PAS domain-containing protein/ActR/RegA family two-component response regulator